MINQLQLGFPHWVATSVGGPDFHASDGAWICGDKMSLSEGRGRSAVLAFFTERVRRDLQFSNIFRVDFTASIAYSAATLFFLAGAELSPQLAPVLLELVSTYAVLHAIKILLVIYLEKQGGDAREFIGSEQLVTRGVYAFSRNPVYVLSLVQSFVWSLILICLGAGSPHAWLSYALAAALLYGHYWGMDRLIIPHEEAALRRRHPEAFATYCARVRRWFGRRLT